MHERAGEPPDPMSKAELGKQSTRVWPEIACETTALGKKAAKPRPGPIALPAACDGSPQIQPWIYTVPDDCLLLTAYRLAHRPKS